MAVPDYTEAEAEAERKRLMNAKPLIKRLARHISDEKAELFAKTHTTEPLKGCLAYCDNLEKTIRECMPPKWRYEDAKSIIRERGVKQGLIDLAAQKDRDERYLQAKFNPEKPYGEFRVGLSDHYEDGEAVFNGGWP